MSSHRTHVVLPDELIKQIDELVGKRGRSAFLAEVAEREIIRLRQQRFFKELASLPPEDLSETPELENAAEWVRKMRQEDQAVRDKRLKKHQS